MVSRLSVRNWKTHKKTAASGTEMHRQPRKTRFVRWRQSLASTHAGERKAVSLFLRYFLETALARAVKRLGYLISKETNETASARK